MKNKHLKLFFMITGFLCFLGIGSSLQFEAVGKSKPKQNDNVTIDGNWVSPCQYLGGGEYQQEVLVFKNTKTSSHSKKQRWKRGKNSILETLYLNSKKTDCSDPWIKITSSYTFPLDLMWKNGELDLTHTKTEIKPYSDEAVKTLNKKCSKIKFHTGKEVTVDNRRCSGFVPFHEKKKVYYTIIKIEADKITLGKEKDVIEESNRPTQLASYGFTRK
ncbi:hypothetical protein KKA14_20005 [bacterium]|nr:hypothetical protein [bacterium]